jgi:glutathione synthase/RimK-type ligase-like ATP-grasp enzyme
MIAAILNKSEGKWVFDDLAQILSKSLWIDVSENPGFLNYILCAEPEIIDRNLNSFIPLDSIRIASDKREIEKRFKSYGVARPQTFILETTADVESVLTEYKNRSWILKYPTGCGGMNHRILEDTSEIPTKWPKPYILQEFIQSIQPEVYRFYCIDGDLFGFNARRFSSPEITIPWVSHANGARYCHAETPNLEAIETAKAALIATGLYDSFGVVDLVKDIDRNWYALEVGTDGIYNHVDRDIDNDNLLDEINERLAIAFWKKLGTPPWGKTWKYREVDWKDLNSYL